jgi:hypothetical protein
VEQRSRQLAAHATPASCRWELAGEAIQIPAGYIEGRVAARAGAPMRSKERSLARVRDEPPGARSTVVGVQTAEEFPDRPLGSEHVKCHMLPMLRNDLEFALRF